MTQEEKDNFYMRRCLQLAENGRQNAKPNPMVGAVLVADGRIIGEGYHVRCGEGHAEVNCFASVRAADAGLLPVSTLYVSLEPCSHYGRTPPCADLIVSKGVQRVVVGCVDPFAKVQGRGIQKLRDAGIEVTVGVLEAECLALNSRFVTFHNHHRPYIILKWAQTADGYIDNHHLPTMISTPFTQMLSHKLRAEADAILVGRVTAERDCPRLNVREWSGADPERIILSHETSIDAVLQSLYERQRQSLIVEGGSKTLEGFLQRGLWDEIRVERAAMAVGDGTPAPQLPADIRLKSRQYFGGNTIEVWERRQK